MSPIEVDEAPFRQVPSPFQPYISLLDSYPLLRTHSLSSLSGHSTHEPQVLATHLFRSSSAISLTPLKLLTLRKALPDTSNMICQYEVPGGGECRDRDCQDIHLSRLPQADPSGTHILLLERFADYMQCCFSSCSYMLSRYLLFRNTLGIGCRKSDEETAQYLAMAIPPGSPLRVNDLRIALEHAHLQNPAMGLDGRVSYAITSLTRR